MSHKTVERLVKLAEKRYEKSVKYNEDHPKGYPDYAFAASRKAGAEVWTVQIMDGEYTLSHYGTGILVIDNSRVKTLIEDISVFDQNGMNGFIKALGIPNANISRAGRTAKRTGRA